jgi:hypothetical protein
MKTFISAFSLAMAIAAPVEAQCNAGEGGGSGFPGIENVRIAYSTEQDGSTIRLRAATIVRASSAWLGRNYIAPQKPISDFIVGGGASIGPVMVMYDSEKRRVLFDSTSFAMGDMNILLLEVSADGVPKEVGRSRVDPQLPGQYSCDPSADGEHQRRHDALLWVIKQSPLVEPFLRKP